MRTYLRWLFALALASAATSPVGPAHADEIADARRAFVSGMKHFDLAEYDQALADFKNGYRAKEDPVFLYNIAQCYRMKKENRDAIRWAGDINGDGRADMLVGAPCAPAAGGSCGDGTAYLFKGQPGGFVTTPDQKWVSPDSDASFGIVARNHVPIVMPLGGRPRLGS